MLLAAMPEQFLESTGTADGRIEAPSHAMQDCPGPPPQLPRDASVRTCCPVGLIKMEETGSAAPREYDCNVAAAAAADTIALMACVLSAA